MRILFMGTPDFADYHLKALFDAGFDICGVVTQQDSRKGRGQKSTPSPVKVTALQAGVRVYQPAKINTHDSVVELQGLCPDVAIVVAYGQILSKKVLDIPRLGCINVHASLLPHLRGAAPIHRAIMQGMSRTGVTTMFIDEGMDTGDIILQRGVMIQSDDTAGTLHDKMAEAGAGLLVDTLNLLMEGNAPHSPQRNEDASYAPKLSREDGQIDWSRSAHAICNQVRGLNPWPVAYTFLAGDYLKVWKVQAMEERPNDVSSGCVVSAQGDSLIVSAGDKLIRIEELQPAGKRKMSAGEFMRGYSIEPGMILGSPE